MWHKAPKVLSIEGMKRTCQRWVRFCAASITDLPKSKFWAKCPAALVTDEAAPFRSQAQQSSGRLLTSQYWQKESRQTGARTSSQRQRSHKAVTRSWKSKEGTCNDVGSTKISKQTMGECVLWNMWRIVNKNHEPRCSHLWTYENTLNLTMENHHC